MAGVKETATWENHIYQIEENDPVHGGEEGVTNKPIKHLANRTLYLRKLLTEAGQRIQPKKITGASKNSVDLTGHTHEIESASTSAKGLVQLTNDTGLDSELLALTAKAGKAIMQSVAQLQINTTNSLNNKIDKTSISDSISSTSQTTVSSSLAVKTAYDKGVEAKTAADNAQSTANAKLPLAGGQLTGNLSLRNGSDYNNIYHYNSLGKYTLTQGSPDGSPNFYAVAYFNSDGTRENAAFFPKDGSAEFVAYQSWVSNKLSSYILNSKKSNSITSSSNDTVATSLAVKTAYDKGVEAKNAANNAQKTADSKQSPASTLAGYGISDFKVDGLSLENLNAIQTAGIYGQPVNVNATSDRNYPENKAGTLLVTNSAYRWKQTYYIWDSGRIYTRNMNANGGWNDWIRVDAIDSVNKSGDTMTGHLLIKSGDYSSIRTYNSSGYSVRWESAPDTGVNMASILLARPNGDVEFKIAIPAKNGTMALTADITKSAVGLGSLENYSVSDAGGKRNYALRNSSGDIVGRLFKSTYQDQNFMSGALAFRVNDSSDNFTRYCNNPSAVRKWLSIENDFYAKSKFKYSSYSSHYKGAEVYKIPMSNTGGLMIITLRADVNGSKILNLPEAYKTVNFSVNAVDVGEGRFSLGANRYRNNQVIVHGVSGRLATVSIQCIGWVDF